MIKKFNNTIFKKLSTILILTFIFSCASTLSTFAQEENDHFVGLMIGADHNFSDSHSTFTTGLAYEYLFSNTEPQLGVGLMADVALYKELEIKAIVPMYIHPFSHAKMFVGMGVINIVAVNEETIENKEFVNTTILTRLGGEYAFELEGIELSPGFAFDFYKNKVSGAFTLTVGIKF